MDQVEFLAPCQLIAPNYVARACFLEPHFENFVLDAPAEITVV
jgi:hypothetical protein